MANITQVTVTAGVPTAGTGTVSTLDNLLGPAGTPSAQVQSVQGVAGGTAVPVSAAALPLPAGAATATGVAAIVTALGTPMQASGGAVAATLNAETTKVIGVTRTVGNAGAVLDFAGQNAAAPANSLLVGAEFNTTPTTLTSGNASPLQLDSAGNLLVNIKTGASSGAVAQGSTTSGQSGGLVQGAVTTAAPTYTTAQTSPVSLDTTGGLRVTTGDLGSGTGGSKTPRVIIDSSQFSALGQTTSNASAPVVIASDQSPVGTIAKPSATANGQTSSRVNSAASTNATNLKASAGQVGEVDVFNNAAYAVFLKFYNKASAPTVGTDTPVWTIPVAAGGGFSKSFPRGKTFATGIAYAITKLQADTDTTAVVAGDLTGSIDWI